MSVLLSENCENGQNGWTPSGTGTFNYADSVVGQQGSHCFSIISAGATDNIFNTLSSAVNVAYFHFRWRYSSLTGSASVFTLRSAAGIRFEIQTSGVGGLQIRHGTSGGFTSVTDAVPVDTWVHVWGRYVIGTGTDGVGDVEWSTSPTGRVGSQGGTNPKYAEVTTGTATSSVNRVYLGAIANETQTVYYDEIIVDDAGYPTLGPGPNDLNLRLDEPIIGMASF